MALKPVVPEYKAVETAWGKLINQKDAYKFGVRHIAAFSANLFQLMRIIEPDWEKRTAAISETAYGFNMAACEGDDPNDPYIRAEIMNKLIPLKRRLVIGRIGLFAIVNI